MVLGSISLDPASEPAANGVIQAERYLMAGDMAHRPETAWLTSPGTIFLNPPGGKEGSKSMTGLFWTRMMRERVDASRNFQHGIFLAFSIEALQHTQCGEPEVPSIGRFTFCVPSRRIAFEDPCGEYSRHSSSHANMVVYVPGTVDKTDLFCLVFRDIGIVLDRIAPGY